MGLHGAALMPHKKKKSKQKRMMSIKVDARRAESKRNEKTHSERQREKNGIMKEVKENGCSKAQIPQVFPRKCDT